MLVNEPIEEIVQGTMSILVKDGVLQLAAMHRSGISKQNLFSTLRQQKILNLGKVKRVYFEACGLINVYEDERQRPGLTTLPMEEKELKKINMKTVQVEVACTNCGNVSNSNVDDCTVCGKHAWMMAVIE